jgi:hypothetical protein
MIQSPPASDQKPVTRKKTFRAVGRSTAAPFMRLNAGKADRNGQAARNGTMTVDATR